MCRAFVVRRTLAPLTRSRPSDPLLSSFLSSSFLSLSESKSKYLSVNDLIMIISADCIEGTSSLPSEPARLNNRVKKKKKKTVASRNLSSDRNEHFYKIDKCLTKLSNEKTRITWKCLLNEILQFDSEVKELPSNVVLISKLNNFKRKERDQYSIICNEAEFLAISKLAKQNKCSFSIIVKYLRNEVFDNSEITKQKYIDELLKPNSVHLSINVLNDSYTLNDEIYQQKEQSKVNALKNIIAHFQENLFCLESSLNSFVWDDGIHMKENSGFICDHCDCNIVGIRYHCTTCTDFDFCEACEALDPIHDSSHLFLKIKPKSKPTGKILESNSKEPLVESDLTIDLNSNLSGFKTTASEMKEASPSMEKQNNLVKEKEKEQTKSETKIINENEKNPKKKIYNVEPGSKITKCWKIRNNGVSSWNQELTLKRTEGNIEPIEEQRILKVPLLKPGKEDVMSITFKIPSDLKEETEYFSVWRFCYRGKLFGKPLNLNITVRPIKPQSTGVNKQTTLACNSNCDELQSLFSDDASSLSDESVIFPPCFNLDIPFLQTSSSDSSRPKLNKMMLTSQEIEIDLGKIDKKIDSNCPNSGSCIDSTSDSADYSIASKLKTHSRKWKETRLSNRKEKVKKLPLRQAKPISNACKYNDLLIPISCNSIIEKIKSKNETIKNSSDRVPIPSGLRYPTHGNGSSSSELNNEKVKSQKLNSNNGELNASNLVKTASPSSTDSSMGKIRNEKSEQTLDPFADLLPHVSRTFSQLCNMFANPGPSHPHNQSSDNNNPHQNAHKEMLKNALQKLYEMGFCNEALNVELLIKNNFDIQRTVHELFSSFGNNLFSPLSGDSPTSATSASQSANNSAGSKGQNPDGSFSVDSED